MAIRTAGPGGAQIGNLKCRPRSARIGSLNAGAGGRPNWQSELPVSGRRKWHLCRGHGRFGCSRVATSTGLGEHSAHASSFRPGPDRRVPDLRGVSGEVWWWALRLRGIKAGHPQSPPPATSGSTPAPPPSGKGTHQVSTPCCRVPQWQIQNQILSSLPRFRLREVAGKPRGNPIPVGFRH